MSFFPSGGTKDLHNIKSYKDLETPYTFEKKLEKYKESNNFDGKDKFCPNIWVENDRRTGEFLYKEHLWEFCANKEQNKDHSDKEIKKYISGILNILLNVPEDPKKDKTYSRRCCNIGTENRNLRRLLSLRLDQITRIKDLCILNKKEFSEKTTEKKKIESPKREYYLKKPVLNLSEARFDSPVLSLCLECLGWKTCNYNAGDIYWFGMSISMAQMCNIISTNKCVNYSRMTINRFPDFYETTRKSYFYHLLDTYAPYIEGQVDCFPKSFRLPNDLNKILGSLEKKAPMIFKPSNGSMGEGVRVVTVPEDISEEMLVDYTAQEYISSPLLIDGKKFDIRVYLLLVDCGKMKSFISKNSLVRVCTESYEYPSVLNTNNYFIHLTNYSINKSNTVNYHRGEDVNDERNNKRPLKSVLNNLEEMGYDKNYIWSQIVNISKVVTGTLYPEIYFNNKLLCNFKNLKRFKKIPNMFQILGLDVIIDIYGKAWLLEVNCSPSLKTNYFDGKSFKEDSVDLSIKVPLITQALDIVNSLQSNQVEPKLGEYLEDWEEVKIEKTQHMENLMFLFNLAKGENWKNGTLSKREWINFCKKCKIMEIGALIGIIKSGIYKEELGDDEWSEEGRIWEEEGEDSRVKREKRNILKMGRSILGEIYSDLEGRRGKEEKGICFSYFVILLGTCSYMLEKWIKTIEKKTILGICEANNISICLDLFSWNDDKPDNFFKIFKVKVTQEFLGFINYYLNLDF